MLFTKLLNEIVKGDFSELGKQAEPPLGNN